METKALAKPASDVAQWIGWGNYHRAIFGWKSEAEVEMVAMWIGTFRRWQFTVAEMYKASESLLKRSSPAFKREDHINYLYQAVNDLRATARNIGASMEDYTRGVCTSCFNCGLVTVPLLRSIVARSWVDKKTCGVWCTCVDGRRYSSVQTEDGRKLMGITEYTARNPDWKEQLGNLRAVEFELDFLSSEARAMAKAADPFNSVTGRRTFDDIRNTLAVRFGLAPDPKAKAGQ